MLIFRKTSMLVLSIVKITTCRKHSTFSIEVCFESVINNEEGICMFLFHISRFHLYFLLQRYTTIKKTIVKVSTDKNRYKL